MQTALREAQDEVRVLKRATKNSALESQQLAEETMKVTFCRSIYLCICPSKGK